MPVSTFMGLQTSLRGLLAHQQALNTTSHNVANANAVGYSRQTVDLTATSPLVIPANSVITGAGAQLGTGVDVTAVRRIRDTFLDLQYRAQAMKLGDAAARANSLEQAEIAFAEPSSDGISAQLAEFWDAWSAVARAPEDDAARQALVTKATTLAATFQSVYAQLTTVAAQAQQEYDAITGPNGQIDLWSREIAQLNETISHAVAVGQTPSDLMDRRDLLIDRLAELGQVSVTDTGNSNLRIEFGGVTLVDPLRGAIWPQTLTRPGGKLGALQELASPTGPALTFRARLDAVAADLVARVNALHAAPAGVDFFDPAGATADRLTVVVTAATVQAGSTTDRGANDVALAIAQLRAGSTDRLYNALVAEVGGEVQSINRTEINVQALVDAIEDRRQSVQGVSLDEEMANLMRFQRGYEASARAMTTIDDLLDTLINRTGRVGL